MKRKILMALACWLGVSWVSYAAADSWINSPRQIHSAFQVGQERDGRALYLCHGVYQGSIQPGKTWRGYRHCNIAFAGKEKVLDAYAVFVLDGRHRGYWAKLRGMMPKNAMKVGEDVNGKSLYLCHGAYANGVQPGKTWRGSQYCNISYAGKEVLLTDYRVYLLRGRPWEPKHRPHHHHGHVERQCLEDAFGNQACGYGCVKTIKGVQCAAKPHQFCMSDDFGNISCGYNCIKTMKGVFCAKHSKQNCVSNAFGDVRCGKDCRVNRFEQFQCAAP